MFIFPLHIYALYNDYHIMRVQQYILQENKPSDSRDKADTRRRIVVTSLILYIKILINLD